MVRIALSGCPSENSCCASVEAWCAGPAVTISCIIEAVNHALLGCQLGALPPPNIAKAALNGEIGNVGGACTDPEDSFPSITLKLSADVQRVSGGRRCVNEKLNKLSLKTVLQKSSGNVARR